MRCNISARKLDLREKRNPRTDQIPGRCPISEGSPCLFDYLFIYQRVERS